MERQRRARHKPLGCLERMVGDFVNNGQFLPGAKVAFVFAKETWSKIPASYWMREIRLAIRLLISLNLLLVSV
jgi:hypothetical protein